MTVDKAILFIMLCATCDDEQEALHTAHVLWPCGDSLKLPAIVLAVTALQTHF